MAKGNDTARTGSSKPKPQAQPSAGVNYTGGGGTGGGSSKRSSGSSGAKADPNAKAKNQAAVENLGKGYAQQKKRIEDDAQKALDNITKSRKTNDEAYAQQQKSIRKNSSWQPQQQREQSTYAALRNRMGNAAYGSGIADLNEGMSRVDDMGDVELINAHKNNLDAAYQDWLQADTDLVNDYNTTANDAAEAMDKLGVDYLFAMNNINPLAAKKIDKAAKNATVVEANKAAMKKAQAALATAKQNNKVATKNVLSSASKAQNNKYAAKQSAQANAKNVLANAKNDLAAAKKTGNAKKIAAAQKKYDAAKNNYTKAKTATANYLKKLIGASKYGAKATTASKKLDQAKADLKKAQGKSAKVKKVTADTGNNKVTLPSINLAPSKAFQNLVKNKDYASGYNKQTQGYIRPNDAVTRAEAVKNSGAVNTAMTAYQPYAKDTLSPDRRYI